MHTEFCWGISWNVSTRKTENELERREDGGEWNRNVGKMEVNGTGPRSCPMAVSVFFKLRILLPELFVKLLWGLDIRK
jgi:hypothetical protein